MFYPRRIHRASRYASCGDDTVLEGCTRVNGLKIPFGEREGRMYGPKELPTGLACGAFCPSCQAPLIAKNRHFSSRRRTAHFSHAHGFGCAAGAETAVHRMAKQILLESGSLYLPEWSAEETHWADEGSRHVTSHEVPGQHRVYNRAQAEVPFDGFRPDVVLAGDFGDTQELLVEIFVAHAVSDEKKALLKTQGRFAIEIYLPQVSIPAKMTVHSG